MKIVVGIDGSANAQRALDWTFDAAARRGAEVVAVYAYPLPRAGTSERIPSDYDVRKEAERIVDDAIAEADPPENVRVVALVRPVNRNPASVLVQEAKGADLLVVGSRGMGGFEALRLGSVSAQCAAHAPCPVVVLPPVEREVAR